MERYFVPFICLIAHLSVASAGPAVCENGPTKVMLTAFEPFLGREKNASALIARHLAERPSTNPCLKYEVCLLPVEYERGSRKAKECFEKSHPRPAMVIAMGEGGCELRLETKAHNLNDSPDYEDNAGRIRENQKIDQEAGDNELLTLPVPDMYCASNVALGPPNTASVSPGYFVCNDVAFRLARYLKPKKIPFGFIHVPVADLCDSDTGQSAAKIDVMAQAAIRALSVSTSAFAGKLGSAVRCPVRIETSIDDVKQVVPLSRLVTAACRAQVIQQLRLKNEDERRSLNRQRGDIPQPGGGAD